MLLGGTDRCSCRLALDGPRVVDIEFYDIAGGGRRSHQRHALRGVEAVPGASRIDRDHSSAKRKRLGWPIVANELQDRRAIENVNQLVAGKMGFPVAFSSELGNEQPPSR